MRRLLSLAVCLALLELLLRGFRIFDWGYGSVRALLVIVVGLGLLALPRGWRLLSRWLSRDDREAPIALGLIPLLVMLAWDARIAYTAIRYTAVTGEIRLDQGQNTYRASLELLAGRNPYGRGEMLDPVAFGTRQGQRAAAGVGPTVPSDQVAGVMSEYWRTLDPTLRRQLLPEAAPGNAPGELETRLLGYKYGPVPIAFTALLAWLIGPLSIPILNVLTVAILLGVIGLIARRSGIGTVATLLTVAAVAGDIALQRNYIAATASDIWPLLFGFIAILAWLDGAAVWVGLLVGVSVSSKLFPGLIFAPLLLCVPRWRSFLGFLAGLSVAILPFLLWDAHGIYLNVVAWSTFMEPDSTSWVATAAPVIVKMARFALALVVIVLGLSLPVTGPNGRFFLIFSLMAACIVLAGSAFHNNYVPWFSIFAALAVTEAWRLRQPPIGSRTFDLKEAGAAFWKAGS